MRTVTNGGLTIAYWTEGTGAPIVWLQGLNADHTAWASQIAAFRGDYRCVAIDNRDAGRSGRAARRYTTADLADDASAVLDTLRLDDAHVVGLSMGGAIAQELALRYPEWVRSLTLVSCFARPDNRLRELLAAWARIYPKLGPVDFALQSWPWLFTWRFFERPSHIQNLQRYAERNPTPQEPDAFSRQVEASLTHDTYDRLGAITCPTLVIAGAEDALVPPYLVRELASRIPGARYEELAGVGHSANLEGRVEFNRLLRSFLAAQDR